MRTAFIIFVVLPDVLTLTVPIIHQGDGFVVVAKPAGLVVHRNEFSAPGSIALLQILRDQLGHEVNPVHRLDAGTSGCCIFADASKTAMLQRALTSGEAQKTYYAMARGNAAALLRDSVHIDRDIRDSNGVLRTAQTELWCAGGCDGDEIVEGAVPRDVGNLGASLVVARPRTGRWHQIRRHLNGLSHPILNDAKHGDSRVNRWWRKERGLRHLGLHCAELQLQLDTGEIVHVRRRRPSHQDPPTKTRCRPGRCVSPPSCALRASQVTCPPRAELSALWRGMPWWEEAAAALPLLHEDDPWSEADLAELDAIIKEADGRAAAKKVWGGVSRLGAAWLRHITLRRTTPAHHSRSPHASHTLWGDARRMPGPRSEPRRCTVAAYV